VIAKHIRPVYLCFSDELNAFLSFNACIFEFEDEYEFVALPSLMIQRDHLSLAG
jgi:hypothetical protein